MTQHLKRAPRTGVPMFKAIALSLALLAAPALCRPASPSPAPTKQVNHAHAKEVWVCNVFYKDPAPGHVCTYRSGKKGKCAWCGMPLVKAGSKEDLERQAKVPKK